MRIFNIFQWKLMWLYKKGFISPKCIQVRKYPFNVSKFQNLPFSVSSPLIVGYQPVTTTPTTFPATSSSPVTSPATSRRPSSSPATFSGNHYLLSFSFFIPSLRRPSFLPAGDHHLLRRPSWLLILVEIDRERGLREGKFAEKVRRWNNGSLEKSSEKKVVAGVTFMAADIGRNR